jgi:hypothetical protein
METEQTDWLVSWVCTCMYYSLMLHFMKRYRYIWFWQDVEKNVLYMYTNKCKCMYDFRKNISQEFFSRRIYYTFVMGIKAETNKIVDQAHYYLLASDQFSPPRTHDWGRNWYPAGTGCSPVVSVIWKRWFQKYPVNIKIDAFVSFHIQSNSSISLDTPNHWSSTVKFITHSAAIRNVHVKIIHVQ